LFFKTSFCADLGARINKFRCAYQAFAGSNPEGGAIFVATSTSSSVAVLRTLPEMVMRLLKREGVVPPSRQDGH
jgi:hypothetical protein